MRFIWNGSPRLSCVVFLGLVIIVVSPVRPARAQHTPSAPPVSEQSKDKNGNTAQGRGAAPDKIPPAPPTEQKTETPTPTSANRTLPVAPANWWEDARTKVGVVAPVAQALLQLAQLILTAIALLAAALFLILVKHGLFPALQLRIELAEPAEKSALVIRLTAENKSPVSARLKIGRSRRQILEYDISRMAEPSTLGEWIPFYRWRQNDGAMKPIQWNDSVRVMTSTTHVEPGEVIRIELLHRASNLPNVAIHCGFQVRTVPLMPWLYFNKRRRIRRLARRFLWNPTNRFTTTAWILVPAATRSL